MDKETFINWLKMLGFVLDKVSESHYRDTEDYDLFVKSDAGHSELVMYVRFYLPSQRGHKLDTSIFIGTKTLGESELTIDRAGDFGTNFAEALECVKAGLETKPWL